MPEGVLTLMFSVTGSLAAYRRAGVYDRFRQMLRRYTRSFERVFVCTFDTGDWTDDLAVPGAIHCGMPAVPFRSALFHLAIPFLHRRLRDTSVVRTFNITGALPGLTLRALAGCPVFVSYGYSLPDFIRAEQGWFKFQLYRAVEQIALASADRIICATPPQREALGRRYGQDKIVWLPNYVDTERFRPPVAGPARDEPYLLFVGRLEPQKNLVALLQGLALARDRGFDLPLCIAGDGTQRAELQALAQDQGLPVVFEGVVPNEALPECYGRAFVFVLPSLYEGLPKALLEAMSSGCACLAADIPGIRDVIEHGRNGLLCPPTAAGIAERLLQLRRDNALRRRLGASARQHILDHYSMDAVLGREIAILQEAMRW